MEDQYIIPGGDWHDETADEKQHIIPGGDWIDSDESTPTPPVTTRRRPTIIACGG